MLSAGARHGECLTLVVFALERLRVALEPNTRRASASVWVRWTSATPCGSENTKVVYQIHSPATLAADRRRDSVVFRSAKERPFAERKATIANEPARGGRRLGAGPRRTGGRLPGRPRIPVQRSALQSVSGVSSSRTGTVRCRMIGPWSYWLSAKWTVQPLILAP